VDNDDYAAGLCDEWVVCRGMQASTTKKKLRELEKIRLERFHEGKVAQIMHVGPFADEGPTIEMLDRFLEEHGYVFRGKHHEIYLSDLRRVAPDKMRTGDPPSFCMRKVRANVAGIPFLISNSISSLLYLRKLIDEWLTSGSQWRECRSLQRNLCWP
jgi:hypothetical protein